MEKELNREEIRQEFAKELIDTFLDNAEELNFVWHYGEESMLVTDIINLINNVAKTDYKRYGNGFLKHWEPYVPKSSKCYRCEKYFTRHGKSQHREHCIGKANASNCIDFGEAD